MQRYNSCCYVLLLYWVVQ